MKRYQFDLIIRSVAAITGKPDILVVGSQAILGSHPDIDHEVVVRSDDLDVSGMQDEQTFLNEIAGSLGELSPFQVSNDGAYADPVVVGDLVSLPTGWRERLIRVETASMITPGGVQARAWCLHPNDIVVSKLSAGRKKDLEYCEALIELKLPSLIQGEVERGLLEIADRDPAKSQIVDVALALCRRAFAKGSQ